MKAFKIHGLRSGRRPCLPNHRRGGLWLPGLLWLLPLVLWGATEPNVLRIAGNPELAGVVARWSEGFAKIHPGVRIETHLTGSDTGMAFLYTGKADVALLGRTPTPSEVQAFEWIHRYKPLQLEVLTGSLDRAGRSPALVLVVHRDNPLASLSLAQLDAIFGTEHRLVPADLRTWDQFGLGGPWTHQPITLYGPDAMSGTGRFFRHVVLNDSRMMNWPAYTEFADRSATVNPTHDAGQRVVDAVAKDRHGLGVTSLGFVDPRVRVVPLAGADGIAIAATRDSVIARTYPLARAVVACVNRRPDAALAPLLAEFLRYVLTEAGQQAAVPAEGFLPLTPDRALLEARKLD
jgi:phosphate transport system substrate-binding protein